MKKAIFLAAAILLFGCNQSPQNESSSAAPNMTFGGWSGTVDDNSMESQMTRKLMTKYTEGNFRDIADMISDDSKEYFFNDVAVDKEGWLSAAEGHHDLFDTIANDKVQAVNLTTARFDNGSVWSLAWFQWTGKGKFTGEEVKIYVHHGFRFEGDKIVAAYHFFDPSLFDREIAASKKE